MEFLNENLIEIISGLVVIAGVVVRLTPTEKDNSIFNKIKTVLDLLIPNNKKDGSKHK